MQTVFISILVLLLIALIVLTIFQIAFTRSITNKIKREMPFDQQITCPLTNTYTHTLIINTELTRKFNEVISDTTTGTAVTTTVTNTGTDTGTVATTGTGTGTGTVATTGTGSSIGSNVVDARTIYNYTEVNKSKTVYHPFHYISNNTTVTKQVKTEIYNPIHIVISGTSSTIEGLMNNDYTYALFGNTMCYVHFDKYWNIQHSNTLYQLLSQVSSTPTKVNPKYYVLSLFNMNFPANSDIITNYAIRDYNISGLADALSVVHVTPFTTSIDGLKKVLSVDDIIGNNNTRENVISAMLFVRLE